MKMQSHPMALEWHIIKRGIFAANFSRSLQWVSFYARSPLRPNSKLCACSEPSKFSKNAIEHFTASRRNLRRFNYTRYRKLCIFYRFCTISGGKRRELANWKWFEWSFFSTWRRLSIFLAIFHHLHEIFAENSTDFRQFILQIFRSAS